MLVVSSDKKANCGFSMPTDNGKYVQKLQIFSLVSVVLIFSICMFSLGSGSSSFCKYSLEGIHLKHS